MLSFDLLLSFSTRLVLQREESCAGLHRCLHGTANPIGCSRQSLEYADVSLVYGTASISKFFQEGAVLVVTVALNLLSACGEDVKLRTALQLL